MASPVGSFNRITLENAQKELPLKKYLKYTLKQIHDFLDKHGIEYNEYDEYGKKIKKEDLYELFLIAFMEDSNLRTENILQTAKQTSKQARKKTSRKAARKARRASKKAAKK
jgi:arsenate reductase-like glutaredoxin family protein